jgi:hypothetical protein
MANSRHLETQRLWGFRYDISKAGRDLSIHGKCSADGFRDLTNRRLGCINRAARTFASRREVGPNQQDF